MKDTLIVIPAYNEERGIGKVLESLKGFDDRADVLVVNDGSRDRTLDILFGQTQVFVSHPVNLGYGAALQTAYKYAASKGYKYVVQFDADGQHHPEDLRRLIREMRENSADVVIGSRVLGDSAYSPGLRKSIALLWFRAMITLLTRRRVTDPTSGLKGLSSRVFSYYAASRHFPMDFPDADMIIDMLLRGFTIREFPIGSQKRTEGVSMHSGLFRQLFYMLKVTLSIVTVLIHHQSDRRKTL
ncbi:glycosyltransferase family 2 protein [Paenibacillus thermotolerans]|uniref:glycosyltransferase family 2 protein n=1 Tax=Paenibacillus thermotolerans TaxID=3027807 RepID=UPI0023685FBA|nr:MULTISPECIES: glycosyltransferase family 2 protein [unclassified Paenibacillus]